MVGTEKIKVLIASSTLGLGGAEMQFARLIPKLNQSIFHVEVLYTLNSGTRLPSELIKQNGIVATFLDRERLGRLRYFYRATKFVEQKKIDIVHAFTGTTNIYARLPAIFARVPVILGGQRGRRTSNGIYGLLYSLTNYHTSGWIVNAEEIKRIVQKKIKLKSNRQIYVVPNGIDTKKGTEVTNFHKTIYDELRTNQQVVGTVSRLVPVKNHALFIKMAYELKQLGVNPNFWIIGDGPLRADLEKLACKYCMNDSIRFWGYRSDVDEALKRMDVFVLTSDSEGCPNVILEAMNASLPIISTNCSSLNDIIKENKNGFIVPKGDPKVLAQKVKYFLDNPEAIKRFGNNSRNIVKKKFDISVAAKRLQNVYIDCLIKASKKNNQLREKLLKLGVHSDSSNTIPYSK